MDGHPADDTARFSVQCLVFNVLCSVFKAQCLVFSWVSRPEGAMSAQPRAERSGTLGER